MRATLLLCLLMMAALVVGCSNSQDNTFHPGVFNANRSVTPALQPANGYLLGVSTIPSNGDLNPYGVAIVPSSFPTSGTLQPGDILVANFNASSNMQGTGTTIVRIDQTGAVSTFFTSTAIGLDGGLAVLSAGFVVVANLPSVNSGIGQGSVQVIDASGNLVTTLTDPTLLNGPWDLAVAESGSQAHIFVSSVNSSALTATAQPNGIVTRIDASTSNGTFTLQKMTQIASGYATRTDPAAFVVGPAGLAYDATHDTLFVASEAEQVSGVEVGTIFSVAAAASTTTPGSGLGTVVYADPAHLHGPLGLSFAPDGNLLAANTDAVNGDMTQPSEIVEFTTGGQFVTQMSTDPLFNAPFGLAVGVVNGINSLAAVNDDTNTLTLWNTPQPYPTAFVNSSIPPTGPAEVNPYGIAYVPPSFPTDGTLQPGDILIANFNDPTNTQGTGTTLVRINNQGQSSTFFTSTQLGLDTALVVLQSGFVVVGNLPSNNGNPGQGALQIIDKNGNLVQTLTDATFLNGPWDMAVNDRGQTAQLFVSTLNTPGTNRSGTGQVNRIDLSISGGTVSVQHMVNLAGGYATRLDPAAFVVGPTGLAYDSSNDTLFVASTVELVSNNEVGTIFSIPGAGNRNNAIQGLGQVVYADANHLRGPLGMVMAPNGHLIIANGDAVNSDPTQASELVEFTTDGKFVRQVQVDLQIGGAFGLAVGTGFGPPQFGGQPTLATVDDVQSTVMVRSIPTP